MTLVKHPYSLIKRGGGGSGYLYNLRAGATEHFVDSDIILEVTQSIVAPPRPVEAAQPQPSMIRRIARRVKHEVTSRLTGDSAPSAPSVLPDRIPDDFDDILARHLTWGEQRYGWMDRDFVLKLFECDLLFANDIWMADYIQRLCPAEAQHKMVLISHSPTWTGVEMAAGIVPGVGEEELKAQPCVRRLIDRHLEIMSSISAVMWPCPEAVPEYPEWAEANARGIGRNIFGETGVLKPDVNMSPSDMRKSWGVEPDQRIILFIGRAHPHKGFDRFVDWADVYRATGESSYVFVHAGAAPETARDISSIRPIGYINDNGAAYLAADLVVVPNRHSYLDIGLLEAMSLGAKVAVTPTGGHGMVAGACPYLPTIPEGDPISVWNSLAHIADEYAAGDIRQQALIALWEERFSVTPFYENHIRVVQRLLS